MFSKCHFFIPFLLALSSMALEITLPRQATLADAQARQLILKVLPAGTGLESAGMAISEIRLSRSSSMQDDEYSAIQKGPVILLSGGGSRGVFYSACAFLERSLGVRIWNTSEQHWPAPEKCRKIHLPNWHVKPAFQWKETYNHYFANSDDGLFAAFNRLNGGYGARKTAARYGGNIHFGKPYSVHTFAIYFPEKEYFAAHPEYFALRDGKRKGGTTSQLCLSNPEVKRLTIEKMKKYILTDEASASAAGVPPPRCYDLSINDNHCICQCKSCQAVIKEEGAVSGLVLRFINDVAAAMEKFRPEVVVTTLAYYNTEVPPKKTRPRGNVMIRLCDTISNAFAPLTAPENQVFRDKLEKWKALGARLYIWDYSIGYVFPNLPFPSEYFIQPNLRYLRSQGVSAIFMEHESPDSSDMHTYKTYLETKLMDNPEADFEQLSSDFLNGYYGAAAPHVRQYRELLFARLQERNSFGFSTLIEPAAYDFLDGRTALQCSRILDQAAKAVAGNSTLTERVNQARLNLDRAIYVLQRRWSMEFSEMPKELNAAAAMKRAEQHWSAAIRRFYQPSARAERLDSMKKELGLYRSLPLRAGSLKDFKDRTPVVDYTPDLFNLQFFIKDHKIVEDPESPTGYAVQVKNAVRPFVSGGGYVGSRNWFQFSGAVPEKDLKPGGYHWYRIAEFTPQADGYLYFLPGWAIQVRQDVTASKMLPGEVWDYYVRVKIDGLHPAEATQTLWIDRIVTVPHAPRKQPAPRMKPKEIQRAAEFSQWTLSNPSLRPRQKELVLFRPEGILFQSGRTPFTFFSLPAIPVMTGTKVRVSFTAWGTGSGKFGFYSYAGSTWQQTAPGMRQFAASEQPRNIEAVFTIDDSRTGSIRPLLQFHENARISIKDYRCVLTQDK